MAAKNFAIMKFPMGVVRLLCNAAGWLEAEPLPSVHSALTFLRTGE
jgi:hypothetical protein